MATRLFVIPESSAVIEYSDDPEDLRYCDRPVLGAPREDDKRYHVPGTDGNVLVRGGQASRDISVLVHYRGTEAAAYSALNSDLVVLSDMQASLTFAGITWERCNLSRAEQLSVEGQDGSGVRIGVMITFTVDGDD